MTTAAEAPGARGEPVALAFTDVEGSSAAWEGAPEAMRQALVVHDAALRACLASWDGYEVKTEGDAFMCAFRGPREALGWALAAQEALARAAWPDGIGPLRVRMGVHVGQPWSRPDPLTGRMDYFGPVVNRAARIAHAGHGGQVLCSAVVWEQAALDGVAAADLGEHRLRGLSAPERLWQVLPLSLAGRRFPPLRTEGTRVRVAEPAAPWFGREEEVAALEALLASARLVTVTGAGGVGKSRLAHEVAWRTRASRPGGVTWCDVSGLRGADAFCAAVAAALDLPAERATPVAIASALSGRGRSLLVLDNADGLVGVAGEAIARWAETGAAVIVTSRSLFGARAERAFPVGPLPTPSPSSAPSKILASPSVALLVAKAREAAPGFVAGAAQAPDLARLVRLLDGLPLAIGLAAARMRLLSPAQLVERLGERLSGLDRTGALQAAFEASWEALGPWEREAFAQLSIFEGSFDLDAAEAVLALPPEAPLAIDVVQELVDRSLVHTLAAARAAPRFRVLATLRAFGRERLGSRRPELEARHLAWFASRRGDADEIPDLRSALDRALPSGDSVAAARLGSAAQRAYLLAGPNAEAVVVGERVLALPDLPAALRTQIRSQSLQALRSLGRNAEAAAVADVAIAEAADDASRAALLVERAWCALLLGRHADARADLDLAGRLAPAGSGQATVRAAACVLARAEGRLAEAAAEYPAVIVALERGGETRSVALAANNYGVSCLDLDRLTPARRAFERAVAAAAECQDRRLEGLGRVNLGLVDVAEGHLQRARDHLQQALDGARELGDVGMEANSLAGLGMVELAAGSVAEAEESFAAALALARRAGFARLEGNLLGRLALCALDRGEKDRGRELLEEALERHEAQQNLRWKGWTLAVLGAMDAAAGRLERADERMTRAGAVARELALPWLEGVVGAARSRLLVAAGRPAVTVAAAAVDAIGESDPPERVLALVALAEAELAAGDVASARAHAATAEDLMRARALRRPSLVAALAALRASLARSGGSY
jgi:class 3 adenylate cyclase/predicted ATPase/Tfp pilus assembly protein PilF